MQDDDQSSASGQDTEGRQLDPLSPADAAEGLALALNQANKQGCYTLSQSGWILQALDTIARFIDGAPSPCKDCDDKASQQQPKPRPPKQGSSHAKKPSRGKAAPPLKD